MPDGSLLELEEDFEDSDCGINLVALSTTVRKRVTGDAQTNFISTSQIYNQAPNNPDISRSTLVGSPDTQFTGELSGSETANIIEGGAGDDKLYNDMEFIGLPAHIAAVLGNDMVKIASNDEDRRSVA